MDKNQTMGMVERFVYGAVVYLVIKFGASYGMGPDEAAWIAGGVLALGGGAYSWWHNRPNNVLNRAGNAVPKNVDLVMTPTSRASAGERAEVFELARNTNDKITAKI